MMSHGQWKSEKRGARHRGRPDPWIQLGAYLVDYTVRDDAAHKHVPGVREGAGERPGRQRR